MCLVLSDLGVSKGFSFIDSCLLHWYLDTAHIVLKWTLDMIQLTSQLICQSVSSSMLMLPQALFKVHMHV